MPDNDRIDPPAAFALLVRAGASPQLVRHSELVLEAADALLAGLAAVAVPVDAAFVRAGAIVHDAGKALHPDELRSGGSLHEAAGERLLLGLGAPAALARTCRSHAAWRDAEVSFEERLVALADTLWKGARSSDLETCVIDGAAARAGRDRWEVFVALDTVFESIADGGAERLARSGA